jgi:hypothetical protein
MYFPQTQITTDLYTNGKEYVYANSNSANGSNGTFYVGYYFKVSNGKFYTGKNPNDPPVQELIIPVLSKVEDAEEGKAGSYTDDAILYLVPDVYARSINLGENDIPPKPPTQYTNLPSQENYELGEYQRYFASKQNEIKYTEISLEEYDRFANEEPNVDYVMYKVFQLPWLISGKRNTVYKINKLTVERIQNNNSLIGFQSYFKDRYDQFFKYTPGENLKTKGNEFLIQGSNKPYSGLYHIHPKKGPMVGAQHTNSPHNYLIPISGSNIEYKINKTETQKNSRVSNRTSGGY